MSETLFWLCYACCGAAGAAFGHFVIRPALGMIANKFWRVPRG